MPKKRKPAAEDAAATAAPVADRGTRRRLVRLEKRLVRLAGEEAKRSRQLGEVRVKLDDVRARIDELDAGRGVEAEGAGGAAGTGAATTTTGHGAAAPQAYCMREKRKVAIANAEIVVLKNGRRAYAGACPGCGARVVAIVGVAPTS